MIDLPGKDEPSVIYRDKVDTSEKLERFARAGLNNFQIVADFDYTLTSWDPTGTCFSVIRTYPGFGEEFLAKTNEIKNKHLPIHLDFTLPEEFRKESDRQWFSKIIDCFIDAKFPKTMIPAMLEASRCRLREGVVDFLKLAHMHHIPVLIFSGGIKDVIDVLLERENCYFDNVSIISNRLRYDDTGIMVGAEEPHITASSKLEVAREDQYFKRIIRDNMLLLGDMLSDLKMASCVKYSEMLTVGFCNIDKDKKQYSENFDVLLMGNPGFQHVNEILKAVISSESSKAEL